MLAYPSVDVALTNHIGKEAFVTTLGDHNLQLEVMKWMLAPPAGSLFTWDANASYWVSNGRII